MASLYQLPSAAPFLSGLQLTHDIMQFRYKAITKIKPQKESSLQSE